MSALNEIVKIQREDCLRRYKLSLDSVEKVFLLIYKFILETDFTFNKNQDYKSVFSFIDHKEYTLTQEEQEFFIEKFPESKYLTAREIIKEFNIRTTTYQNPSEFCDLIFCLKETIKLNSNLFKSKNFLLVTTAEFYEHASVSKINENTFCLWINIYLIYNNHYFAYYYSYLLKTIKKKFSISNFDIEKIERHHIKTILQEEPNLINFFADILVSSILTEKYSLGCVMQKDILESNDFWQISSSMNGFILNHELGHIEYNHFDHHIKKDTKNKLSDDKLSNSIINNLISLKIPYDISVDKTKKYMENFYKFHMDEIMADNYGIIRILEIAIKNNSNAILNWIGISLVFYKIKIIEKVNFINKYGFDYVHISKIPYVVEALFPCSHPYVSTRVGHLNFFNEAFEELCPDLGDFTSLLFIPFDKAQDIAFKRIFETRDTEGDISVITDHGKEIHRIHHKSSY